jgi:hypothetical protein
LGTGCKLLVCNENERERVCVYVCVREDRMGKGGKGREGEGGITARRAERWERTRYDRISTVRSSHKTISFCSTLPNIRSLITRANNGRPERDTHTHSLSLSHTHTDTDTRTHTHMHTHNARVRGAGLEFWVWGLAVAGWTQGL